MTALVPEESKPLVTIIVPARDEERHIARCLDSLLSQDYQGICKILVLDGISHDRTREFVEEISRKSRLGRHRLDAVR